MKQMISVFFFILFLKSGFGEEEQESKLKNLFTNMHGLVYGKGLMDTVTCQEVTPNDFTMLLYTRTSNDTPTHLNISNPQLDTTKNLIILSHGWIQSATTYGMQRIKNEYLKRYDSNIIVVNWEDLAYQLYSTAVCTLPKIGKNIANYLCDLHTKHGLKMENVHMVGHSLGGQLAGHISNDMKQICGQKFGRITGLDPAGPLYVDTPRENRLDSTDATFVQVVHTSGGSFGYYGKCGHADFFVKCGSVQGSCDLQEGQWKMLNELPMPINALSAVICYHMRALDIWVEAINSDDFKAIPCSYCPIGCPPLLSFGSKKTIMGESCPTDAKGGYYLSTNSESPYAKSSFF